MPGPGLRPLHLLFGTCGENLSVFRQSINGVLRERRGVSPKMALRLGHLFGNPPEFWLNVQKAMDLWAAAEAIRLEVVRIKPLKAAQTYHTRDTSEWRLFKSRCLQNRDCPRMGAVPGFCGANHHGFIARKHPGQPPMEPGTAPSLLHSSKNGLNLRHSGHFQHLISAKYGKCPHSGPILPAMFRELWRVDPRSGLKSAGIGMR
jgi:addiction module HigA family antidote